MRRWVVSLARAGGVATCLAICMAGSARAATLDFTGTLGINIAGYREYIPYPYPPSAGPLIYLTVSGAGSAQFTDDGNLHLLSLTLPSGAFGPATAIFGPQSVSVVYGPSISSLRFTLAQNLSGSFSGLSGGPPGGGPMGLSGMAKICLIFSTPGTCSANIPLPMTLTPSGAGFGIGGTAPFPGPVAVTMQNAPWTIGQPTMTLHSPASTITVLAGLPGGFAHGPASLTSSTAQVGGVLQLVTVSKVYTNLYSAFPDMPLSGVLTLHFVPEPGTLLLLGSGVAVLAAAGRRRSPHQALSHPRRHRRASSAHGAT